MVTKNYSKESEISRTIHQTIWLLWTLPLVRIHGNNTCSHFSTFCLSLISFLLEGDLVHIRRTWTTRNLRRNDRSGALTAAQSSGNHSNDSLMITRFLVIIRLSTFVCDSNTQMKEESELLWFHRFKRSTVQRVGPLLCHTESKQKGGNGPSDENSYL